MGKFEKQQPKPVKKKVINRKKRFIKQLQNAIVVIASYLLVFSIVAISAGLFVSRKYQIAMEELTTQYEGKIEQITQDYEAKIFAINQEHEYGGNVDEIEKEAEFISKVIYGTAKDHSSNDQRAVVWCVLNRVESVGYPNTVAEVCRQPKQWMGYSDDNPVLSNIYDLVLNELKIWHNEGRRPMSNEFVFLSWSSKEIVLRNTFEENKSTKYWRMY